MIAGDRAGKSHWDSTWQSKEVPRSADLLSESARNHVNREFARFLREWLRPTNTSRLIELGCARSIWLPFLARELGYSVTGLDYSERGSELARASLAQAGVNGEVVTADFFDPPAELVGRFDAAVSFGVAEHFDDTARCISAFSAFLRPGGRLVTLIPNMTGLPGLLQKRLNTPVYEKHVPLDAARLEQAHRDAGLFVRHAGYLVSTNFGVLNLEGLRRDTVSFFTKRCIVAALSRVSLVGWMLEPHVPMLPVTAAYVCCVADRPGSTE